MSNTGIGARVERLEDQRFITGTGNYTDDINMEGQVYAAFRRSEHAHASVRGIDKASALDVPGVIAVFTGADLQADGIGALPAGWMIHSRDGSPMNAPGHPCLVQGKARYVGDPIAVVIAQTQEAARAGAEALKIDFDVHDALSDPARARTSKVQVHEDAPANTCYEWEIGDADAVASAFADAAHVTRLELVNNRLVPNAMEPRAALGAYDPGTGHYTTYTTSQNPHVARLVMSAFVNLAPEHKLRVIAPDVGGGFGSKIYVYPEEVVCTWAARKVGRAVKWTAARSESFITDAHGRDHVTTAELALDERGRMLALKVHTIANLGGYASLFATCVPTYLYATLLSGQYDIPAIHARVDAVYTNTVPVDAYRGAGRPEATFVVERLAEVSARELGIDPATLRKRNFVRKFPHQTPVIMMYDAGDYAASLNRACELIDYKGFGKRRREAGRRGKLRGIGFSTYIEACGIAPSAAVGSLGAGVGLWESAEVRVNPTGNVEVLTGSHSHGQGHETTFAQLVSERLGIGIDQVSIVHGDTDKVQFGMGTYGSRSGAVGMTAISKALDKVEAKARKIAAHLLEASEDDVEFSGGEFSVAGTDRKVGFAEVALNAYVAHRFPSDEIEPGLKEGAFHDRPISPFRPGATSARWRSTRKPVSPKSSTGSRWMISASSSIR